MTKTTHFKTIPVILALVACSNQSYLPPLNNPQVNVEQQKNTFKNDELQSSGYQESLNTIKKVSDLVKANQITENQGKSILKKEAKEYFEKTVITDEGTKAQTLAEAILALNEGKIVENLTDLLGLEVQFEMDSNQLKRLDRLFQVLNRESIANQVMTPKKDRFLIEVLLLIQNREKQKRQFVDVLKSAQVYFENRTKLLLSDRFQLLEAYSLLSALTTNHKWIAQLFVSTFNQTDIAALDREIFSDNLKSVIKGLNQSVHSHLLTEQLFKNAQYLLRSRIQILSNNGGDKSQHLQDLVQTLDLVNYFFDVEDKNISIFDIQVWDQLLVENSKINEQIRLTLVNNKETFKIQRFHAKHLLTQAVLFKAYSDKSLKWLPEDQEIHSQYISHKASLLSLASQLSMAKDNTSLANEVIIKFSSYRKYFSAFEGIKNYLNISSTLAAGKILPKGFSEDGKIINSEEFSAKIYAENILSKALDILYKNNLEAPSIKNCLIAQNNEDSQKNTETCKTLNDENLKYSLTSKLLLIENPEKIKHISLFGEGKLYVPAGRFSAPAKSTLEITYPEIEFHPLAKIEIISGNININTGSIVNAYLDVSAVDQNQFNGELVPGTSPKIVKYETTLGNILKFNFFRDVGHHEGNIHAGKDGNFRWDRVIIKSSETTSLEEMFKGKTAMLGGQLGQINVDDPEEEINVNNIENNLSVGIRPHIVMNSNIADGGGKVKITLSKELNTNDISTALIFSVGGNGVDGMGGVESPLCNKKSKYIPFEFVLGNESITHKFAGSAVAKVEGPFRDQINRLYKMAQKSQVKVEQKGDKRDVIVWHGEDKEDYRAQGRRELAEVYTYALFQIDIPGASPTSGGSSGDGGAVAIKGADQQVNIDLAAYVSAGVSGKGGKPAKETCRAPGEVQLPGHDGQTGKNGEISYEN